MLRWNRVAALLGVLGIFVAGHVYGHNVRIYNDTDVELNMKVFHFENPGAVWDVGVLDVGRRSSVQDLAHGNRILVAKDAITGEIVFTHPFKVGNMGRRLRLRGTSPDIHVDMTYEESP